MWPIPHQSGTKHDTRLRYITACGRTDTNTRTKSQNIAGFGEFGWVLRWFVSWSDLINSTLIPSASAGSKLMIDNNVNIWQGPIKTRILINFYSELSIKNCPGLSDWQECWPECLPSVRDHHRTEKRRTSQRIAVHLISQIVFTLFFARSGERQLAGPARLLRINGFRIYHRRVRPIHSTVINIQWKYFKLSGKFSTPGSQCNMRPVEHRGWFGTRITSYQPCGSGGPGQRYQLNKPPDERNSCFPGFELIVLSVRVVAGNSVISVLMVRPDKKRDKNSILWR